MNMYKIYLKQAWALLKENKLLSGSLYLRYGLGDLHDHGDRDRMADAYRQLLTGRLSGPDDVRQ